MINEQFIKHLIDAAYPGKRIKFIEAVQFQNEQKSDAVVSKSIANGLYIGDLLILPVGSAFAGSLTLAVANSVKAENIQRIVKDGQPAFEMKGVAFDGLTPTYAGTDAAGTKICNTVFAGYKVTFE